MTKFGFAAKAIGRARGILWIYSPLPHGAIVYYGASAPRESLTAHFGDYHPHPNKSREIHRLCLSITGALFVEEHNVPRGASP